MGELKNKLCPKDCIFLKGVESWDDKIAYSCEKYNAGLSRDKEGEPFECSRCWIDKLFLDNESLQAKLKQAEDAWAWFAIELKRSCLMPQIHANKNLSVLFDKIKALLEGE